MVKIKGALERSIQLFQNPGIITLAQQEAYTASVIKHFELFYELFWKFLKYYLEKKYGTDAKRPSKHDTYLTILP